MIYWSFNADTKIIDPDSYNAKLRGGIYHIPKTALTMNPITAKDDFAVIACDFDNKGKPHNTTYIEDHRGKTIWDKTNALKEEQITELGPIKEGFTESVPKGEFDEWVDGKWVTNESSQFIATFNKIDDTRRRLYTRIVSPLMEEARIKRLINTNSTKEEAAELEQQALAARAKIQKENPWPSQAN